MAKVTFACECPQSIVGVLIQSESDASETEGFTFRESGSKTVDLPKGEHFLTYRALGTPKTNFSLTVTKGGTMSPVDRTLPSDGRAAGDRALVVE
jgi:hypothetical protein